MGTFPFGDSVAIFYAYIFNDSTGLDYAIIHTAVIPAIENNAASKPTFLTNTVTKEPTVSAQPKEYETIAIIDVSGRQLMQQRVVHKQTIVNTSELPCCIFYLTLKENAGAVTHQFLENCFFPQHNFVDKLFFIHKNVVCLCPQSEYFRCYLLTI